MKPRRALASAGLLALVVACSPSAPPPAAPAPDPVPSAPAPVASASAAPAPVVDAGAARAPGKFTVVTEIMTTPVDLRPSIARLATREPAAPKLAPIEPRTGPLAGDAATTACFVATGLDDDSTCEAAVDRVAGATLDVTVKVELESDTMQSRARTRATLHGTVTVDPATHAVVGASFRGREEFQLRSPCEKLAACESCDPLVRKRGCKPACFCPFTAAGTAELETTYR